VIAVHGAIHLTGFAKAFGLADLPQLTEPISRPMSLLWLGAAVLLLGAAGAVFVLPRWFVPLAAVGMVLSQVAILTAWGDARYGTIGNVILLAGLALRVQTAGR
jgi:ethanolamine transporter EutH